MVTVIYQICHNLPQSLPCNAMSCLNIIVCTKKSCCCCHPVYIWRVCRVPAAAGMMCFCVHKLSIIGGQRTLICQKKYPHTHWRWRSWCWCEYKWQRSSARTNCPSLTTTTTTTPNLLTQASLNVLLSLRLSFFQVLCFSHQRSTSLRPGRLTAISSRSRTGSGGRWSPWPPSATGTWRRTLISMLEPWPLFSLVMSQDTHTLTYTHHLSMALHHLLLCFSCQQQKCMTAVFN